jgi:hypothetical protein
MITHTHRPLRVVLYEGNGSIALPAESRAKVMMALLDQRLHRHPQRPGSQRHAA